MKDIELKLKKSAEHILLTTEEKDAMRTRLLQFMQASAPEAPKKSSISPFVNWYRVSVHFKAQYISVLTIILLIGSGISAAAEQSLPGEALYQVKSFNENVRVFFTVTPQSKAGLQTELAVRRLEEVELLTVQGKLSTTTKEGVEKDLAGHLDAIKDNVKALENSDQTDLAADTASQAESSLKAHGAILNELAINYKDVKDVALKVNTEANAVALDRDTIDSLVSSSTLPVDVVLSKQKQAQSALDEVNLFITNMGSTTATSTITATTTSMMTSTSTVSLKLATAEDLIKKGSAKLNDKQFGAAYIFFQKAHRVSSEAKILAEAKKDLDITVPLGSDEEASTTATSTLELDSDIVATTTASTTIESNTSASSTVEVIKATSTNFFKKVK